MLSSWTALLLAPVLSLTATYAHEYSPDPLHDVKLLDYSRSTAYTKFQIPCPGCFDTNPGTNDLVFEVQVKPSEDLWSSTFAVNEHPLEASWRGSSFTEGSKVLDIPDSLGSLHRILLTWSGYLDSWVGPWKEHDVTQHIQFYATPILGMDEPVPDSVGFGVFMRPASHDRLVGLVPNHGSQVIDFARLDEDSLAGSPIFENGIYDSDASSDNSGFDLETELESLGLLEDKAREIQVHIAAKRKAIYGHLKQEREKPCLKDLIKECDGIICAAKALAQRMCDRIGIAEPSLQHAIIGETNKQHTAVTLSQMRLQQQNQTNYDSEKKHLSEEANLQLMLTKNVSDFHWKPVYEVKPVNALVRALALIGAVLGISALFAFLKRRCMSMRRRVERAADLEQRRNQRAYRRAARRALMRKRWERFVTAVNCFGRKEEPRIEDYEEKRALILQDAFLEQDLDAAEKGEIMEAEIRELRYAQEIVSGLLRVDERRYDLVMPINDPPPPLVPLPRTPGPRSRASTYTLPSYTSESLPDYTSRVGGSDTSSSLVHGYTPSTSEEHGRRSPTISVTDSSSIRTRYTPTSSIRETSPRPSQETIRTRPSADSRY